MAIHADYDALLFDLDGTVWEGGRAIEHAVEAIGGAAAPCIYITNNASRGPEEVAGMLNAIGIGAAAQDVLTSAMAAVELLAEKVEAGAKVLVLGADSFKEMTRTAGFQVVDSADDAPAAVLQGHSPATGWAELSEAALAIRAGALYFASNLDTTLPMERGLCVGNGSMVAAVVSATGVEPVSAGKPLPAMFHSAARRAGAARPLAVGDRLNTDIAGGVAAGMDSLHVLTGVSRHFALVAADASERPTYLAEHLGDLSKSAEELLPGAQGEFVARREGADIVLAGGEADSTPVQALRTVCALAWEEPRFGGRVLPEGEHAARVLGEWQ